MVTLELLLAGVMGYLLGAIPTGVLVCRAMRGVDVRQVGSSHTGGLNASRAAGIWGGVLTGAVDLLLGAAAVAGTTLLARDNPWAATAAGVMAVVGHNWSVFIRFAGGIGLSSLTGALLCLSPWRTLGALAGAALFWLILVKLLRFHRARSTILAMVLVGPLLWALGMPPHGALLGALGGAVVIIKTLPDWNRKYEQRTRSQKDPHPRRAISSKMPPNI
jgi:glycerol-3-phosphate acyltransferase PlsY